MKTLFSVEIVPNAGINGAFLSFPSLLPVYFFIICFTIMSFMMPDHSLAGEKAWLGVQVQPFTRQEQMMLARMSIQKSGVLVSEVAAGSPAEQMGIRQKYIIFSINYKDVKTPNEFTDAVATLNPGDKIVVSLLKNNPITLLTLEGTMGQSQGADKKAQIPSPVKDVNAGTASISANVFAPRGHREVSSAAVSPDGKHIISAGNRGITTSGVGGDTANYLKLWDISTGKEVRTFIIDARKIYSVAFSPDGKHVLSGSENNTIKLWDAATGKEIRTFKAPAAKREGSDLIFSLAFSPDGLYALSGCTDKTLKLWEVATGREIRQFTGHADWVKSVAFSPDGHYALSGGTCKRTQTQSGNTTTINLQGAQCDKNLILWELATGRELRTLTGHTNDVSSVAFSPDGKYALSGSWDSTLKLWDVSTGREIRSFEGKNTGRVNSVAFSSDGKHIISATRDNAIRLWDVATGREINTFRGHEGDVNTVAFSNDAKSFISGGSDGTIRRWDVKTGKEIAQFISLKDGEWIVITQEGYYNSSPNGHKFLNIRVSPKVYGIDQFYDVFYRPDIVAAKLRGDEINSLITLTIDDAIKNPPPTVKFASVPSETAQSTAKVCYRVTSAGGGIGEIRIFQNGKLIKSDGFYREVVKNETTAKMKLASLNSRAVYQDMRSLTVKGKQLSEAQLASTKGNQVEDCLEIEPIAGENEISLTAFNAPNTVQSFLETAKFTSTVTPVEPHLYILSVGIDKYRDASINLKYAAKDAVDFSARLSEKARTLYKPENIHLIGLANEQASKQNILATIDSLSKKIKHGDCFILFDASHGLLLQGQYYIVTSSFDGKLYNTASLISSNEIVEISKKIKSLSQLFIFDTCHAGGVDTIVSGLYDARMSVLAKKMGLHIFASAGSVQTAMDGFKGNGLYTHTLLQGIGNGKDVDSENDGTVTVTKLGRYSKNKTTEISSQLGYPQTPFIINFGRDNTLFNVR
ncbi:MAG: caspase family protein [Deltaproteobacteria bacterium]